MDIAETVKVFSAALAPIVAIGAAVIAFLNVRTAKHKIKIDLFEKRMKIFEKLNELVDSIFSEREDYDYDEWSEYSAYINIIKEAKWLFDEKTIKWIDDNLGIAIREYEVTRGGFVNASTPEAVNKIQITLHEWRKKIIRSQHYMPDVFTPHLQLHKL